MSLPDVVGAYVDCYDYFERAMAATHGIRVEFSTEAQGTNFVMRMHQARALLRRDSRRIYDKTAPQWNTCIYDQLMVRRPVEDSASHWWVYVERQSATVLAVEELSPENHEILGPKPQLMLEPPNAIET